MIETKLKITELLTSTFLSVISESVRIKMGILDLYEPNAIYRLPQ